MMTPGRAMNEKPFLSVKEAAELIGISIPTMYKYRYHPDCPVIKRGKLFFDRAKLIEWWAKGNNP